MSKKHVTGTRTLADKNRNASYDKLGWVKKAFERARDIICRRISQNSKPAYSAARLAFAHANTVGYLGNPDGCKDSDLHDLAVMGLLANLFEESDELIEEYLVLHLETWEDMSVGIPLTPTMAARELLDSVGDYKGVPTDGGDDTIRLDCVLALYAIQTLIPGASLVSSLYMDLSITSITGWLTYEEESTWHRGTCAVTGKDDQPVRSYRSNDVVKDISNEGIRRSRGWKPERELKTYTVKQVGLPVLSFCPCCITRRAVRQESEEENVPAFPLTEEYVESHLNIMQIGNPINTGQRVLTSCYVKAWPSKGKLVKQFRRQCPACVALAVRNPANYVAYINEVSSNRGKGPVTPKMVEQWRNEYKRNGNQFRYAGKKETEIILSSEEDTEAPSSMTQSNRLRSTMDIAVKFDELHRHVLDSFIEIKWNKGRKVARLLKGVTVEMVEEVLETFGAYDEIKLDDVERSEVHG